MLKTVSISMTVDSSSILSSFMVLVQSTFNGKRDVSGSPVEGSSRTINFHDRTPPNHDFARLLGMRRFFMMLAATLLKILTRSVKFGFAVDGHFPPVEMPPSVE